MTICLLLTTNTSLEFPAVTENIVISDLFRESLRYPIRVYKHFKPTAKIVTINLHYLVKIKFLVKVYNRARENICTLESTTLRTDRETTHVLIQIQDQPVVDHYREVNLYYVCRIKNYFYKLY